MRRWGLVAALAAVAAAGLTGTATAAPSGSSALTSFTGVESCKGDVVSYRPSSVTVVCSPTGKLTSVKWTSWSTTKATAKGKYFVGGHYYPANLTLTGKAKVTTAVSRFTTASVTFTKNRPPKTGRVMTHAMPKGTTTPAPTQVAVPTTTPVVTAPLPSTPPTIAVGQSCTVSDGVGGTANITVNSTALTPPDLYDSATFGDYKTLVLTVSGVSGAYEYNPYLLKLQTPDNALYDHALAFTTFSPPELHDTILAPGQVLTGTEAFDVPSATGDTLWISDYGDARQCAVSLNF